MTTMNPDAIAMMLTDLLAACEEAYDPDDAPEIPKVRYVTFGPAVYDADQITVSWTRVYPSAPTAFPQASLSPTRNAVIPVVELVIEVARANNPPARPGVNRVPLPSGEDRAGAALLLARDATTIFGYVGGLAAEGRLFPNCPIILKGDVALGQMTPIGPSGQYSAFRWPIQAKVHVSPFGTAL